MSLITFSCPAYADITMFGDIALQLLKMMGHSGEVPGAILAEDVAQALEKLEVAIEADNQKLSQQEGVDEQDDEPVITLSKRALPLIELFSAAAKAKCNVMWDGS